MNHDTAQAPAQVTSSRRGSPAPKANVASAQGATANHRQQRPSSAAGQQQPAAAAAAPRQPNKTIARCARFCAASSAALLATALNCSSLALLEAFFESPPSELVSCACLIQLLVLVVLATFDPRHELRTGDISAATLAAYHPRAQLFEWALVGSSSAWSLGLVLLRPRLLALQLNTALAFYLMGSFSGLAHRWRLAALLLPSHCLHLALCLLWLRACDPEPPAPAGSPRQPGGQRHSWCLKPEEVGLLGLAYATVHLIGVYLNRRRARQQAKSIRDIESFVRSRVDLDLEDKKLTRMLESVIPRHLASQMREDILDPCASPSGNFHKSYLTSFDNVSILFADIVNFTKISSNCSPKLLVETLNELFGRFDKAADRNSCLRIKILGDCYYCVSGIPGRENEPHARQCVEMGLDMIDILDDLARDNNQVDLKMRVGIHTGRVLCGILGKKKWQFDVHSNDVKLANHLEQAGEPGRVHISEQALAQLRAEEASTLAPSSGFRVKPANGHLRDQYIAERGIGTYFVEAPGERRRHSYGAFACLAGASATRLLGGQQQQQQPSATLARQDQCAVKVLVADDEAPREAHQVAASVVNEHGETRLSAGGSPSSASLRQQRARTSALGRLKRLVRGRLGGSRRSPSELGDEIDLEALGAQDQGAADKHEAELEVEALLTGAGPASTLAQGNIRQANGQLGPSESASTSTNAGLDETVEVHGRASSSSLVGGGGGGGGGGGPAVAPVSALAAGRSSNSLSAGQQGAPLAQAGLARFKQTTQRIINVLHFIRTIEAPFANLEPSARIDIDALICDTIWEHSRIRDVHLWTLHFKDPKMARRYRLSTLKAPSKLACLTLALHLALLVLLGRPSPTWGLEGALSFIQTLAFFLGVSLAYLHQCELEARRDFIWHMKALEDKSQMARVRDCNKSIFFNLLPPHVAAYFLQRTQLHHMDLYYHSCDLIGVVFATVPNFSDFYSEIQGNDHGKGCLQVLNEILCEFDLILDRPQFAPIDKIKTIGSTYMAAIGLCPNFELPSKESAAASKEKRLQLVGHLKTMLAFVDQMRAVLNEINEHSYNSFKLRVGFNVGPVTAGVIGATKPQYDIWGNTVNVASRMESTCEPHHFIQTTDEVYALLAHELDLKFTCRGEVDVKGKGRMTTYYVDFRASTSSEV